MGQSDVWIQTARHVVRNEYNRSYKTRKANRSEDVTSGDESGDSEGQVRTVGHSECYFMFTYDSFYL